MTDIPPPPGSGEHPAGETTPPPPPSASTTPIDYSSGGYPGPYAGPAPDKDARTMAMLCHLLAIFTGFLGPLIIWLVKKDSSPFVNDQGKEALNFQITVFFGYLIGGLTACIVIGWFVIMAVWIASVILCIMGTMKANEGIAYRYPFAIRLVK